MAFNVTGFLDQAVGEGAMVELSVKFAFIPIKIINRKDPICEIIKNIDLECPFGQGEVAFQKQMMIPDQFIPAVRFYGMF